MRRLNFVVEGQTEEAFVNGVLRPHLWSFDVVAAARCVTTRRDRRRPDVVHRGGLPDYGKARRDLERWMAEDPGAVFTTMFDLYALPEDFPGYAEIQRLTDPYERVAALEAAMASDIADHRLIPYLQLHEFEALLFCDPEKFDWEYLEHERQIARLIEIADAHRSPELIDDGPQTAPSKRIIKHIPEYAFQKASAGPLVAQRIGIEKMRSQCPHFAGWLGRLESIGPEYPGPTTSQGKPCPSTDIPTR
jgi:hypothetical protein